MSKYNQILRIIDSNDNTVELNYVDGHLHIIQVANPGTEKEVCIVPFNEVKNIVAFLSGIKQLI